LDCIKKAMNCQAYYSTFHYARGDELAPLTHMQATGMGNDHTVGCFRYEEIG